ncbi:hypothetical protein FH966_01595 [Lentibacillus cibarius]|uniref:Uncharacterized protein n=1 Tax=Lentibacillus cibarius TaxID=2583219 RepID=A0A549YF90_9BACI|nr:hypothetical protein [Lentibacillus cibarius]TRM10517.1 hypothetical protein FH966_01595 [Lentibacillus cibarius]
MPGTLANPSMFGVKALMSGVKALMSVAKALMSVANPSMFGTKPSMILVFVRSWNRYCTTRLDVWFIN